MTLIVPLDEYAYQRPSPAISVGLTDEGVVYLTVDLEPSEFVSKRKLPELVASDAAVEARLHYLEVVNGIVTEELLKAQNAATLDRRLLPEEARALAAALSHFAEEAGAR